MKALFIQHDHVSPPGAVAERLQFHGYETIEMLVVPENKFHDPNVDFEFPNLDDYDLIVPLGAPWGAWDDDRIGNWLIPELDWIREAVISNKPVLGICFGGQLVARAMGGSVAPGDKAEIGWTSIWSDEPDLVGNGPWFQFHYDRWQLPPQAREIARNPVASQAFVINRALALQFHPELDAAALKGWLDWGGDVLVEKDGQDPLIMMEQTIALEEAATAQTFELIDNFITKVVNPS